MRNGDCTSRPLLSNIPAAPGQRGHGDDRFDGEHPHTEVRVTAVPSADAVCPGESMVTFVPAGPGRLAEATGFRRGIGGARTRSATRCPNRRRRSSSTAPPGPTVFAGGERVHEPAPAVEVVARTGAGDAFATGYLSAALRGLPLARRPRHGHLPAAAPTVPGDLAVPPTRAHADALAALDDAAWGRLRLGAAWTREAGGRRPGRPSGRPTGSSRPSAGEETAAREGGAPPWAGHSAKTDRAREVRA